MIIYIIDSTYISSILKGVHNVDFSGVRDDKCHTGVGESRVDNIAIDAPIHCHRYPCSLPLMPLFTNVALVSVSDGKIQKTTLMLR